MFRFNFSFSVKPIFGQLIVRGVFGSALLVAGSAHAGLEVANGNAVYSHPIAVPPGIAGMVPQLSLQFNGGGSTTSPVWAIKGVAQITRCPSNRYTDGIERGVDYTSADRLCLDGHRLIQTNAYSAVSPSQSNDSLGGYGAAAVREYRTETDTYSRIRAYGSANGDPANGPAYFKIWTKTGRVLELGNNSNSSANAQINAQGKQVVVAWAVSRISDFTGNYIDFQYSQRDVNWGSATDGTAIAGHEWNLAEVRYTGHGGQAPANKIVFEYSDRDILDRSEAFHQGSKTVAIWQLSKVKTMVGATAVKSIALSYETGPVSHRSRPSRLTECAGADLSKCMPAVVFGYGNEQQPRYASSGTFAADPLKAAPLLVDGKVNVLLGNFSGSGRTDILQWSDSPTLNALYLSNGDGSFTRTANGINDENLSKSDGCYTSIVGDFNGDGVTDILRLMKATSSTGQSCGTVRNLLFLATGGGQFTKTVLDIDFTQVNSIKRSYPTCSEDGSELGGAGTQATSSAKLRPQQAESQVATIGGETTNQLYCPGNLVYTDTSRGDSKTFLLVDVNGDGLVDVITTELPGYSRTSNPPNDQTLCAGKICTKLFLQQPGGSFTPAATNLANRSVYFDPPNNFKSIGRPPNQADVNGDKLMDLVVDSGIWLSQGDGNFLPNTGNGGQFACQLAIDFNGDGRTDCISTLFISAAEQAVWVADGTGMRRLSNFNVMSPGQEFIQYNASSVQTAGIVVGDINRDGREDILQWRDNGQHVLYLSNGDGSFTVSPNNGLEGVPLQSSDGTYVFLTGDFSGTGRLDILRLKNRAGGTSESDSNVLYTLGNGAPPDMLTSVSALAGLKTILNWVPMNNSGGAGYGNRYISDRGTSFKAQYPAVDLNLPIWIVAAATTANSSGSLRNITEYSFSGLKGSFDGRGLLGFRETRQQTTAANAEPITVMTRFLQTGSYVGKPSVIEVRRGSLTSDGAPLLSRKMNIYCDTTAPAGSSSSAGVDTPCATSSKLKRPFLYQSIDSSWDLTGTALPVTSVINNVNSNGDLMGIVSGKTGAPAGLPFQSTTTNRINLFYPDKFDGDDWLPGQVQISILGNSVTNSFDSIATTAPAPLPLPALPATPTPPVPAQVPVSAWLPAVMSILLDD